MRMAQVVQGYKGAARYMQTHAFAEFMSLAIIPVVQGDAVPNLDKRPNSQAHGLELSRMQV